MITALLGLSMATVSAQQSQKKSVTSTITVSDILTGNPEEKLELRGNVEMSQEAIKIFAPEIDLDVINDTATARGGVVMQSNKDVVRAPEFKINLNTNAGYAPFPEFFYARHNGRGTAKSLLMSENRSQVLDDVSYTSCKPGQDDWILKADTLTLDEATQTGVAKGASIRFFDVPIFAFPHLEFPLGKERRSGVLTPTVGYSSLSGIDLSIPYYFNLAHNYDLTATTRYMARRGFQFTSTARYLSQTLTGDARLDWLPNDLVRQDKRWGAFSHLNYRYLNWSAGLNIERVSDQSFFADLTKSINAASQTSLPAELWGRYETSWGEVSARSSRYQTLQDATNSIVPAYDRLPVVNLLLTPWNWNGLSLGMQAQNTRFSHPTLLQGIRSYAVPQVSLEKRSDEGFFVPKLAINAAQYTQLNASNYSGVAAFRRLVPVASLDTGLVFERDASWFGKNALQTLEPRLYFLYVPFKDQAKAPLFDTALTGFSFAQIFSENVFTGQDRIADAKHITPAVSSRWMDSESGSELFKATLGKRYYFQTQRVQLIGESLPGNVNTRATSSDWLFAASGQINQNVSIDTALQYDQTNKEVVNSAYTLKYNPSQRQLITLSKRFTKNTQNAIDLSWQWKVSSNSSMMGRAAYSLGVPSATLAKGFTETLIGYEYDAGCWVFRVAANRYNTTANTKSTSLYFQFDLSGLTQVGAGSLETLKRNIPGYLPFESKPTWTYDAFRPF